MEWTTRNLRPSIDIVSLTSSKMVFILLNADVATANAMRRIMLSEIPTLAIEVVTILENTSVLHDEYLAHRLGLLPIDSRNARSFEYRDKCNCSDKCSRCTVEYSLDVKCQGESRVVTHYDIKLDSWDNARGAAAAPMPVPRPSVDTLAGTYGNTSYAAMDGSMENNANASAHWMEAPTESAQSAVGGAASSGAAYHGSAYDQPRTKDFEDAAAPTGGIPIVKLKRGQAISMKMTATKGMGKFHAKWMVANVAYKMEPIITINKHEAEKLTLEDKTLIVNSCPRKVFKLSSPKSMFSSTTKSELVVENLLDCIYCDECLNQAREMGVRDLIRIQPDETKFHFTVESNGAIQPEKILEICLITLEEKLAGLQQHFLEAQARSLGTKSQSTGRPGAPQPRGIDLD
ncbi:DNA-directed RNA polymerase II, putative [Babesia bigemina]|uniref:DNA-directed RNA polymerase II, putative n=1 Tax=Babesia bigemina TaxID=5866 RepID=A0A061D986_BABBI|nr:DNA-directed RNA polymerase II, putative [Babesia bigemina]CDR95474.1 DNA-directed RNA polymerase II, putative [Babesia bigemina]|eukprot:XP_012767660.1 DNA-directed RNA polymerase II, putative [Babesia bigemina]